MDICHTLPYLTGICSKIEITDWHLLYFFHHIDQSMCTVQVFKCRSATGKRHRVPGETWQVSYLYIVSGVGRNSLTDLFQLGKCVTCKQSSSTVGIQVTLEIQKYKICITKTMILQKKQNFQGDWEPTRAPHGHSQPTHQEHDHQRLFQVNF